MCIHDFNFAPDFFCTYFIDRIDAKPSYIVLRATETASSGWWYEYTNPLGAKD